jgi:ASPIC and UnbV/FG-GAP-like repeat
LKGRMYRFSWMILVLVMSHPAFADIKFKEVTQEAGIVHSGTTYGASWGDFNGDGWPDLWVGNHDTMPSLYINNRNGTFTNIIKQVWNGDPRADKHGAAWADFDNDGDQDLIEAVDAAYVGESLIPATGQNLLLLNRDGRFEEVAKHFGLDVRGAARSPLWLDADRDGKLDVLVMAHRRRKAQSPILLRQTAKGFEEFNKASGFRDAEVSRSEYLRDLLSNILHLRFRSPAYIYSHPNQEFAQLADLNGDGDLDLIVYSQPLRVYSTRTIPFKDITYALGFPSLSQVGDVAIADFDGDGRLDMYMTIGPYRVSDVRQPTPFELKATILGHPRTVDKRLAKGMQFRTAGEVHFTIYPRWMPLSKVSLGTSSRHPADRSFTLSPNDPNIREPVPAAVIEEGVVSIVYDPVTHVWALRNGVVAEFVDVIVHAPEPIENVQTLGFAPFTENGVDTLLMRRGDRFSVQTLSGDVGVTTACHSVVAGDFDNDMDMDLYLVCTGPVENLPNRLYENDGHGNFTLVPNTGGAAGSKLGRGDVVAVADYDRDGFLDLFVTNGADPSSPFVDDGPYQLFRNQGNGNHWLEIDLEGTVSNRDGIGARVVLEAGGVVQIREQGGGMHRFTQNHQRIHFGLAKHTHIDRLTIQWPSGIVQHLENVAADQIVSIRERR